MLADWERPPDSTSQHGSETASPCVAVAGMKRLRRPIACLSLGAGADLDVGLGSWRRLPGPPKVRLDSLYLLSQ